MHRHLIPVTWVTWLGVPLSQLVDAVIHPRFPALGNFVQSGSAPPICDGSCFGAFYDPHIANCLAQCAPLADIPENVHGSLCFPSLFGAPFSSSIGLPCSRWLRNL